MFSRGKRIRTDSDVRIHELASCLVSLDSGFRCLLKLNQGRERRHFACANAVLVFHADRVEEHFWTLRAGSGLSLERFGVIPPRTRAANFESKHLHWCLDSLDYGNRP